MKGEALLVVVCPVHPTVDLFKYGILTGEERYGAPTRPLPVTSPGGSTKVVRRCSAKVPGGCHVVGQWRLENIDAAMRALTPPGSEPATWTVTVTQMNALVARVSRSPKSP